MTSLILIKSNIKDLDKFTSSIKEQHKKIIYDNNTKLEDIISQVDESITNLALVYHFDNSYQIPFLMNNFSTYNYVSDDLINLIKKVKEKTNKLTVDLLACDLNNDDFSNEIKKIEKDVDINIRYSIDQTGNYPANWILESDGTDIKDFYFNENINDWKYTLALSITLTNLATWNPSYFSMVDASTCRQLTDVNISDISINASGTKWTDTTTYITPTRYQTFDGSGYSMTVDWANLGIFAISVNVLGFSQRPIIKNLKVINLTGTDTTGGAIIRPNQKYFEIISCTSEGDINGDYSGGICGFQCGSTLGGKGHCIIQDCSSSGVISGLESGGIASSQFGWYSDNFGSSIINCYSVGNITGIEAGGICGSYTGKHASEVLLSSASRIDISGCYSTGYILGEGAGGICGSNTGNPGFGLTTDVSINLTNCYSTGAIGGSGSGGICGTYTGSNQGNINIFRCYSTGDISGINCGGICGSYAATEGLGTFTISQSYSTGVIGQDCGGILGSYAAYNRGFIELNNCYSTGLIGCIPNWMYTPIDISNAGGICGSYAAYNGRVNITQCYSTGAMIGEFGGGIVGPFAGKNRGTGVDTHMSSINITGCYSLGNIGDVGAFGSGKNCGGIAGPYLCDSSEAEISLSSADVKIIGCFQTGENYGQSFGGIVGRYAGYFNKNIYNIYGGEIPLKISQCYSAAKHLSMGGGGICGDDSALYGVIDISNCYSIAGIGDTAGGICGAYCGVQGIININNCYAQNQYSADYPGTADYFHGGILGVGAGRDEPGQDPANVTITINNCYFARPSLDSSMNFYGINSAESRIFVNDSYKDISGLKYALDPNWNSGFPVTWVAGDSTSKYNIYPRLDIFISFSREAWDFKYLTNMRTPDFKIIEPYEVVVDPTVYTYLFDFQIIDLRNWIIKYIQNEILLTEFFMSKDSMGINNLQFYEGEYSSEFGDRYLCLQTNIDPIYGEKFGGYKINPYKQIEYISIPIFYPLPENSPYDAYYIPLDSVGDGIIFEIDTNGVPQGPATLASGKWTMTKTKDPIFRTRTWSGPSGLAEQKSQYLLSLESDASNVILNDYDTRQLSPFKLIAGGCTIQPLLLKPVVGVSTAELGSGLPGNTIIQVNWQNDVSGSLAYYVYGYSYSFILNKWSDVENRLPFLNNIESSANYIFYDNSNNILTPPDTSGATIFYKNTVSSGIDKSKDMMLMKPDTSKYGYRILARGDRINFWDSAPFYDPVEYILKYIDFNALSFTGTKTDDNYAGVCLTGVNDTKVITGGVTFQNSKLPTPILNPITKDGSNHLNISWNVEESASSYKVIRYYYNMGTLQYVYDSSFVGIGTNSYTDTTWNNSETIIGYSVIAISNTSEFTNSDESLISAYINSAENIIMVANIPCYYTLDGGIKVLETGDNTNLKNYFDGFSGNELSNKRSEAFYNYYFTGTGTEQYMKVNKGLLNFSVSYTLPYYYVFNCDYFMETSHFIDVTSYDLTNVGIYVPLKDDKSSCIFYVGTTEPISDSSPIDTYYNITKEVQADLSLKFSSTEGILDGDFNFIPLVEPTLYDLGEVFYLGEYVAIAGGITINNKGPIPCLTEDTSVLTTKGWMNVQKLNKGDYVITDDMRKVQIQNILINMTKSNPRNAPFIIPKKSIANNYPPEDFRISPNHLIKFNNKWIHPRESKLFKQDFSKSIIKYYHIELENYETDNLVINGGAVVESFGGYTKNAHIYQARKSNLYKKSNK